jgi:hypothetical protein
MTASECPGEQMSINPTDTDNAVRHKRYPIRCIECREREVRPAVVEERVQKNHDGRLYEFNILDLPITRCGNCGHIAYTEAADDRISEVLREHLHLLTPQQIRANLEALDLTQKEAARQLGIAPETLCRWISGAVIQSQAMDVFLRAFFACPDMRARLKTRDRDSTFGDTVELALVDQG